MNFHLNRHEINKCVNKDAKYLLIFLLFFIALNGLLKVWMRAGLPNHRNITNVAILLFFLVQMGQYGTWLINPSFTMKKAAIEIRNYVGTEPVVLRASTLAIDTYAPLIVPFRKEINANAISRFRAKFALTASVYESSNVDPNLIIFGGKKGVKKEELPPNATLIKKFHLCPFMGDYRYILCLWRLPTVYGAL